MSPYDPHKEDRMHIVNQNRLKCINLDRYDYIELDGNRIYAYRGENYVILAEMKDEETARVAFQNVMYELGTVDILYKWK